MRTFLDVLLRRCQTEHLCIALGASYGGWLWRFQSFRSGGANYRVMHDLARSVAPEQDAEAVWGSLMIATALLSALCLWTGPLAVRVLGIALTVGLFLLMSACLYAANPSSPACLVYGVLAAMASVRAYQLGRGARGDGPPPACSVS